MKCSANAKSTGKPCQRAAILGGTVCYVHGGAAPAVKAKAAQRRERQEAEIAVAKFGLPREIEPHQAMVEEIHRTAGAVAWLQEIVRGLDQEQMTRGISRTIQHPDGSKTVEATIAINAWIRLYQDERDRLVRVSKAAIEVGVAERQVRIAEQTAQQLAKVVSAIVQDLGHDLEDPKVRETVRMRLIEGGQAE